jgi:hypothetical protein
LGVTTAVHRAWLEYNVELFSAATIVIPPIGRRPFALEPAAAGTVAGSEGDVSQRSKWGTVSPLNCVALRDR